jgi:hypothetical protein
MAEPQPALSVFYLARMHRLEEVEKENARLRATVLRLSAERSVEDDEAAALQEAPVDPDVLKVLQYVSAGRAYVDVEPYPDDAARRALGRIYDEGER